MSGIIICLCYYIMQVTKENFDKIYLALMTNVSQ